MIFPKGTVKMATVKWVDADGDAAVVDGIPVWAVSPPELATLVPNADGMSCVITLGHAVGTLQLSVRADADLGEGVKEVIATVDLEVVAGEAVVGTLVLS
jgi:hypothetical protein